MNPLFIVIICAFFAGLGQILMKKGIKERNFEDFNLLNFLMRTLLNKFILIAVIMYILCVVLWLSALSMLDVSLVSPFMSLSYIFSAILAFIFLNEKITFKRWVGIFLIVIGTYLITL